MLMEVSAISAELHEAVRRWISSVSTVTLPDSNVVFREIARSIREPSDRTFGVSSIGLSRSARVTKHR